MEGMAGTVGRGKARRGAVRQVQAGVGRGLPSPIQESMMNMKNQKEMLVELLKEALPENPLRGDNCACKFPSYEEIAEQLLDRVVVLPYKIGTPLYLIRYRTIFDDSVPGNVKSEYYIVEREHSPFMELGRYIFVDKGEAESKLKELNEELRKQRCY